MSKGLLNFDLSLNDGKISSSSCLFDDLLRDLGNHVGQENLLSGLVKSPAFDLFDDVLKVATFGSRLEGNHLGDVSS